MADLNTTYELTLVLTYHAERGDVDGLSNTWRLIHQKFPDAVDELEALYMAARRRAVGIAIRKLPCDQE